MLRAIQEYKRLNHKPIADLSHAIITYGIQAPLTLSCLDAAREGGELLPLEWKEIARSTLSASNYLLWETSFNSICKNFFTKNGSTGLNLCASTPKILKPENGVVVLGTGIFGRPPPGMYFFYYWVSLIHHKMLR